MPQNFAAKIEFYLREKGKYNFTCSGRFSAKFLFRYTFFPILPVLASFGTPKPRFFFHFPTPYFCRTLPSNLCSPMSGLYNSAKTRYQPTSGNVWVLFYSILRFSIKISAKSRNLGWKQRKFNKIGDVFRPTQNKSCLVLPCFQSRNCETDASHVRMSCLMRHEYLMSILNPLFMKIYNK